MTPPLLEPYTVLTGLPFRNSVSSATWAAQAMALSAVG